MAEIQINQKFYKPKTQPPLAIPGQEIYLALFYDKTNGHTVLKEINLINGKQVGLITPVYEDGIWKYDPGQISSTEEKTEVHNNVKKYLKDKVFPNLKPNEVKAPFVLNDSPSMDTQMGGEAKPSANSNGVLGILGEFLEPIKIDNSLFKSVNMEDLFPKGTTLKYPFEISDDQDKLYITQYEYKSPYEDVFTTPQKDIFTKGIQRGSALKNPLATVILPIPNGASDATSVGWGEDTTGSMAMAVASDIKSVGGAVLTGNLLNSVLQMFTGTSLPENIKNTAIQLEIQKKVLGNINNPVTSAAVQSAILKAAGFDVSAETILARGFGVVSNSNLELLFNGPILRGFSFGYKMSPRSSNEALEVKKIIRYFKQGMAVKKANATNGAGAGSFLLKAPNVFKLRYVTGKDNTPISGMNRFKICALTNFNVNYAPEGKWAAYEGGQPVSYMLQFTFKELEPVYESDYQKNISNAFKTNEQYSADYESIKDTDIGY